MKKLALFLALMMAPFSAFAMDTITDSEMDAVTGQAGVSIALIDFQMDMSIQNLAWGDPDNSGINTLWVAGHTIDYKQGFINIHDIVVKNLFMTKDATVGVGSLGTGAYGMPLKIDVATASSVTPNNFMIDSLGKTICALTLGDKLLQIEQLDLDLYLNSYAAGFSTYTFNTALDEFVGAGGTPAQSDMLGQIRESGIVCRKNSSVNGYFAGNTLNVNRPFPNFPARLYIYAH